MLLDGRRDEDAWAAHAQYRVLWDFRCKRTAGAKVAGHCNAMQTVQRGRSQAACASRELGLVLASQ